MIENTSAQASPYGNPFGPQVYSMLYIYINNVATLNPLDPTPDSRHLNGISYRYRDPSGLGPRNVAHVAKAVPEYLQLLAESGLGIRGLQFKDVGCHNKDSNPG